MENDDARDVLLNVLDRCTASDGPFWEATPEQRAEVSSLLGSPSTTLKVTTTAEGEPLIIGAADMFLAVAILAEIAIDLAETAHGGRTREEAVFAIRERLSVLLP